MNKSPLNFVPIFFLFVSFLLLEGFFLQKNSSKVDVFSLGLSVYDYN